MENAVIYARYSPGGQQNYQSIEGQLKECYDYARRNDLQVINEYIDEHLTGKNDKRPQFLQMIDDSKKKHFKYIIVYQLDRFARNRNDSAIYKTKLKKNGVRVISARENISEDASGILIEGVLESMAEYYSAELSQKILRGIGISASKFKFFGGTIPFGYKIGEKKDYEIDSQTAPYVVEIFKMYAEGKTILDIANVMNERAIFTSRRGLWNKNSIHRMLQNKKYLGIYTYQGKESYDAIPSIVDFSLFEAVQKRMGMSKRAKPKKNEENPFILTGKLFCGLCHGSLAGESGTSRNGTIHYYYKCTNKKHNLNDCALPPIKKEFIEDFIIDITCEILKSQSTLHDIALKLEKYAKANEDIDTIDSLKIQKKDCDSALSNLMKAIEQGILTETTKNRLLQLEKDKEDLSYRIAYLESMDVSLSADMIEFWFSKMLEKAKNSSNSRESIITTFIKKVVLYPHQVVILFNHSDKNTTRDITIEEIEDMIDNLPNNKKNGSNNGNSGCSGPNSGSENEKSAEQKCSTDSCLVEIVGFEPATS